MRRLWLVLLTASACTPLRPLDPGGDTGGRDSGRAGLDASSLDVGSAALDAPGLDVGLIDALAIDATAADAPPDAASPPDTGAVDARSSDDMTDARSTDAGVIARADAGRDAWSLDAPPSPDAPAAGSPLVAWYPFDDLRDATGNGHDLVNLGVAFAGPIGTFDTGDRLSTPSAPDLAEIVGVTMWVNVSPTGGGGRAQLVDRDLHFDIILRLSDTLRCNWGGGAGAASGSSALTPGTWAHVACIVEGPSLVLYVDGVVDASGPLMMSVPPATGDLQIGQACCTGADAFRGDLTDVRFWRRAPTAAELAALVAARP